MRITQVVVIVSLVLIAAAAPARAQYRNQGVQLPNAGWLGLGSADRVIHGGEFASQTGIPEAGWNINDQPTLGAGYFFAVGYQLWVDFQTALGGSTTVVDPAADARNNLPVVTLAVSSGVRYNFLEERHRPFIAAHIQYLQMFALGSGEGLPIPGNSSFGAFPFFVGLRPGVGYEWVFGDEQSVQAEIGVIGFLVPDRDRGLGGLFLPAGIGRLSYNIYF